MVSDDDPTLTTMPPATGDALAGLRGRLDHDHEPGPQSSVAGSLQCPARRSSASSSRTAVWASLRAWNSARRSWLVRRWRSSKRASVPRPPSSSAPADHRRLPVEDHGVVDRADEHGRAGDGARGEQRVLDAGALQPVGEIADGLVVGEVGLADPPGRALADDAEDGLAGVSSRMTSKPFVVHGLGPERRRAAGRSRLAISARPASPARAIAKVNSRSPMCATAETTNTSIPRSRRSGSTSSASSRASGTSALLSTTIRTRSASGRPPSRPARQRTGASSCLDDLEVRERVAAGLQRGAVDHVDEHRAALDVAQELQAEALAPRMRPGISPGTSATVKRIVPRGDDARGWARGW
jgi:hypothetical protein